ncbi:unnamed protein product, partial [Didymodactylos carnosus]
MQIETLWPVSKEYHLRPRSHTPTNDATTNDSVYSDDVQTSFNELSSSILERLNENYILSFEEVKEMYLTVINKRNHKLTDHMIRTTTIKNQLKSSLGDKISFIVETKRNGTYIILNNLNKYALIVLKQQITNNNSTISLSTITNQQAKSQEQNDSELILSSISLLRKTFDEAFKIFD